MTAMATAIIFFYFEGEERPITRIRKFPSIAVLKKETKMKHF